MSILLNKLLQNSWIELTYYMSFHVDVYKTCLCVCDELSNCSQKPKKKLTPLLNFKY